MDCSKFIPLKETIWNLYCDKGRGAVSEFTGIPYNTVGHLLNVLGFYTPEMKKRHHEQVIKRTMSLNPFKEESSIKYYLLGYILGDGSIQYKSSKYRLRISNKHKDFIDQIAKYFDVKPNFHCSVWNVGISDYEIGQYLVSIGLVPNKSNVGVVPFDVPEEYRMEFLAGLIDSDGTIRTTNYGKTLIIEIWGHSSYMPWVQSMIEGSVLWVRQTDGLVKVSLYRQSLVMGFLHRMYSKTPLRLEYKYERYQNFIRNRKF